MSEHRKILFNTRDGIALVTLNRPEKRNALDDELINEIKDAMSVTALDAGWRVSAAEA